MWSGSAKLWTLTFVRLSLLVDELEGHDGVFICIGTSAQVVPASHLIPIFSSVKNRYIIDVKTQPTSDYTLLEGPATAMMQKLADELLGG